MDTRIILPHVCKRIPLTPEEEDKFASLLEHQTIKRKQLLHEQGSVCKHNYYVVSGCLKAYSVDGTGAEHILTFALPDWWMSDLYSLISQKPGVLNIEAVVDTEVLLLSRENQMKLFDEVPKFERFFRILIENALVANQQRIINNLSHPAEERYQQFIAKYPSILEYVPLHNIASYLGITPEFLSKIRARLAKKGQ